MELVIQKTGIALALRQTMHIQDIEGDYNSIMKMLADIWKEKVHQFRQRHEKQFSSAVFKGTYVSENEYPVNCQKTQYLRCVGWDISHQGQSLQFFQNGVAKKLSVLEGFSIPEPKKSKLDRRINNLEKDNKEGANAEASAKPKKKRHRKKLTKTDEQANNADDMIDPSQENQKLKQKEQKKLKRKQKKQKKQASLKPKQTVPGEIKTFAEVMREFSEMREQKRKAQEKQRKKEQKEALKAKKAEEKEQQRLSAIRQKPMNSFLQKFKPSLF